MRGRTKLAFRVKDIAEEYAIISKMLCPSCEYPLEKEAQHMIQGDGNRIVGDLLELRCTNGSCGSRMGVFFYLPEDYDPFAAWSEPAPSGVQVGER
jgi:hypothetical protein